MSLDEPEITVVLTAREARALRNCTEMITGALQSEGRDEQQNAVSAVMKIEVALVCEGIEL